MANVSAVTMAEQDRHISVITEVIAKERPRLRNFIRKRVPSEADVEDVLQDVFFKLVEANRLLMPIEYVTGWLFQLARNRITDLFRKKTPENFTDTALEDEEGELLPFADLLPSLGWRLITFWQGLGLLVLCRILFGGLGRGFHRRWNPRDNWRSLTAEEREKFRLRMRSRCAAFTDESSANKGTA